MDKQFEEAQWWMSEFDNFYDADSETFDAEGLADLIVDKIQQAKKQVAEEIETLIRNRMSKFADTPLDERPNAFEEMVEINKQIKDKYL